MPMNADNFKTRMGKISRIDVQDPGVGPMGPACYIISALQELEWVILRHFRVLAACK
jgi:hypothetical protein